MDVVGCPNLKEEILASVSQKASSICSSLNFIDEGYTVLSIVPSCTLMLKFEWPLLLPKNIDVKKAITKTKDICEFLVENIDDK